MAVNVRMTSRLSSNASFEEQKKDLDKMMKMLRTIYNEPGGIKDKLELHERYFKPSEKRRLRNKIERNRARHKAGDNNERN